MNRGRASVLRRCARTLKMKIDAYGARTRTAIEPLDAERYNVPECCIKDGNVCIWRMVFDMNSNRHQRKTTACGYAFYVGHSRLISDDGECLCFGVKEGRE